MPEREPTIASQAETLWGRLDRLHGVQTTLAIGLACFVLVLAWACAVAVALLLCWGVWNSFPVLNTRDAGFDVGTLPPVDIMIAVAAAAAAVVISAVLINLMVLVRSSKARALHDLDAASIAPGEFPDVKRALYRVSLAVGLAKPVRLMLSHGDGMNAALLGSSPSDAVIVVTRGLAQSMSARQHEAVFASLLGRLRFRRMGALMLVCSVRSQLLTFTRKWIKSRLPTEPSPAAVMLIVTGVILSGFFVGGFTIAGVIMAVFAVMLAAVLAHFALMLALIPLGSLATLGDAEGLMILKSPHAMFDALETANQSRHEIGGAAAAWAPLFYIWPDWDTAMFVVSPSERKRRLREVAGVEGMDIDACS